MDTLWCEIEHALRRLARSPTTSLAAVITMALGMGAVTGAYSITDGLMLHGVSFEEADRLVALRRTNLRSGRWTAEVSERDFVDLREQQQSFEALVGFRSGTVTLRDASPPDPVLPERHSGAWVSAGFLDVLRVDPLLGRGFEPSDAAAGADPVVLMGHDVSQRDYGGAPGVVGRTVRVNAQPATVIGVLPRDFRFPVSQDIWLPLILEPGRPDGEARHVQVIGRLAYLVPARRASRVDPARALRGD